MTITFITGATKGLGYETARRLIGLGQEVLIGARDPERGRVAAEQLGARFVPIDVADDILTTQYARGLPDVRVNAADPGYTAADFNGHSGPPTVTAGTDAIVTLATENPEAGTGRFIDRFGPVPW
jgi:nucleoside-diphosphate-sugar epimerase